jgi:hypothetical protein
MRRTIAHATRASKYVWRIVSRLEAAENSGARTAHNETSEITSSRPLAAAAFAMPNRFALIVSAYCSGIRVDCQSNADRTSGKVDDT